MEYIRVYRQIHFCRKKLGKVSSYFQHLKSWSTKNEVVGSWFFCRLATAADHSTLHTDLIKRKGNSRLHRMAPQHRSRGESDQWPKTRRRLTWGIITYTPLVTFSEDDDFGFLLRNFSIFFCHSSSLLWTSTVHHARVFSQLSLYCIGSVSVLRYPICPLHHQQYVCSLLLNWTVRGHSCLTDEDSRSDALQFPSKLHRFSFHQNMHVQ